MEEEKKERKITLSEVIQKVRNAKLGVEDSTILKYINDIEADVQRNVLNVDLKDLVVYELENDQTTELIIPFPFYDIYEYYVLTMLNYELQEFTAYNQFKTMYEEKYGSYRAYLMNKDVKSKGFTKYFR